jgi:hypothetical protein
MPEMTPPDTRMYFIAAPFDEERGRVGGEMRVSERSEMRASSSGSSGSGRGS